MFFRTELKYGNGMLSTDSNNTFDLYNTLNRIINPDGSCIMEFFNSDYKYNIEYNAYYNPSEDYNDFVRLTVNAHNDDGVLNDFITDYWNRSAEAIQQTVYNDDDILAYTEVVEIILSYMDKLSEHILYLNR